MSSPPPIGAFTLGDVVKLIAKFTDPDTGLPVLPSTVALLVRTPACGIVTLVPVLDVPSSTYRATYKPDKAGLYWARSVATGPGAAIEEHFTVATSEFP